MSIVSPLRATCLPVVLGFALSASAATLCVNHNGSSGCSHSIQAAVSAAKAGDTVLVSAGTYHEGVKISSPLSLIADGWVTIDASGLPNGIFLDGSGAALAHVVVKGFTVQNAKFEGILAVNGSGLTIANNVVVHNDLNLDIAASACPNIPTWETAEGEDCGEGIHLVGVAGSIVIHNVVTKNAGGILLSDETGPTHDNFVSENTVNDNPYDCGITLAGHPQAVTFGTPLGVYGNVVDGNRSTHNGYQVPGAGAGVGIFAFIPGANMSGNVVSNNVLLNNGIPGVTIHLHAPDMNFDNIKIVHNFIAGNGADNDPDAITTGTTGINIGGYSVMNNLIISKNQIWGEQSDVVINVPGPVLLRFNDLSGNGFGVENNGRGTVDAAANWWGCAGGPGAGGCSNAGTAVAVKPWLTAPVNRESREDQ